MSLKLSYGSSYEELERYYFECLEYWKQERPTNYTPEELALIDVENYTFMPVAKNVEISSVARDKFIHYMNQEKTRKK